MRLYLVRHAEAKSKEQDPDRPLTDDGAATVDRVAAFLTKSGAVSAAEARHSTKLRAKQTAERLVEGLGVKVSVREVENLGPMDDVGPLADEMGASTQNLVLVGHLPHLSRLATRLVGGDPELEAFDFAAGGVLCLERREEGGRSPGGSGRFVVRWMLAPEVVPSG